MYISNASDMPTVAVIMAGGAGTRFWPVSTNERPKQFLSLLKERTLIQQTFDRLQGLVSPQRTIVMTNTDLVHLVREQLPELPATNIIGEPCRRDTAGAVALSSLLAHKLFGDCTIVTLTSDPRIETTQNFQQTISSAIRGAQSSDTALYTLGIVPTFPAEGYGYLQCDRRLDNGEDIAHYKLKSFREKPSRNVAETYLASGEYYWNSGIFIWQSRAILGELRRHLPKHIELLAPVMDSYNTPEWQTKLAEAFEKLQRISIDFAVMEKAQDVRMVKASFEWCDVGNWEALAPFLDRDDSDNSYRGQMLSYNAHENIVFNEDADHTIALVGVRDLVVVHAGKYTLIVHRDRQEEVKKLVAKLSET